MQNLGWLSSVPPCCGVYAKSGSFRSGAISKLDAAVKHQDWALKPETTRVIIERCGVGGG
ncbi:hypothetical protein M8994_19930 [Brucella sp. 21LCYQ03]|nr:hypothetical protein [Brucella sp. 21LCYQ03]